MMKRVLTLLAVCVIGVGVAGAQELCTGAEMLMTRDSLPAGRVAVVANQTSMVGHTHLVDTLLSRGVKVVKIFCPEHGFRGTVEAGIKVQNGVDHRTGLPIVSLYGNNKKPTPSQMRDVDLVIFDLQDVGCRFYTYISTLHYVMEACAERGIPLLVLDRPNPNAGYVDGPVLDTSKLRSFVGMHPVPVVYGMTIGEYARMILGERWVADSCRLEVETMHGYRRDSAYVLPVPPSPNLRTPQAIALYPSLCFFEGTTVSVGRGTPWPFEVIGALPDTMDLRRVAVGDSLTLRYLMAMHRRTPKGKFFLRSNFFELLSGTTDLRGQLESGMSEAEIRATWQPGLAAFRPIRARYLLYP